MKWNVGMKIGAGFALALAILTIIGAVSYRNTDKLLSTADWVAHTRLVLNSLQETLSSVKDAETGQRGFLLTGLDSYLEPYRSARARVDQETASVRELTTDNPNQQRRIDKLEALVRDKFSELQETIDLRKDKSAGLEAALKVVKTNRGKQCMDEIRNLVAEMMGEETSLLEMRSRDAQASSHAAIRVGIFGTLAAFVVLAAAGILITRNIAVPLRGLTAVAEQIAVGDLRGSVAAGDRRDEVGALAQSFVRMTQSLQAMAAAAEQIAGGDLRSTVAPQSPDDMLGNTFARMTEKLREQTRQLTEGTQVLSSSVSEIVASSSQLASSAAESAAAVSETTSTVDEVRQTAQAASQRAQAVADSAQQAAHNAQSGRKSTESVVVGMNQIRQQTEAIAASMVRLSEQSQTVGQIIATVDDLAAQSNLLAVNAAIEAAKAGEQGKGFGVVAQEIKSLAEQSRQATNQVRTVLNDIQKATTAAVMAAEQGSKAVANGEQQTATAGESIEILATSVGKAVQAATQIAASSQQQMVGVEQVAGAMESIKQASAQNVASAKQLETASRNLNDLGSRLKHLVDQYKV